MRSPSIFFSLVLVASLTACFGGGDSGPKPLKRHFDEMHVARFPLEQKANIVKTRNDWEIARMENAQAEAQLNDINNQMSVVKNEQKAAKLSVESAKANKKAADASADGNRINVAQKDLHTAELLEKAANARQKYYETYRNYLKKRQQHTAENMYWREAQFELAKAQLAQQNNVAPQGVSYEWYPKQEAERGKKVNGARSKSDSERSKAQSARDSWLKAQQTADQSSGKPTSLQDPMATAPQSTMGNP